MSIFCLISCPWVDPCGFFCSRTNTCNSHWETDGTLLLFVLAFFAAMFVLYMLWTQNASALLSFLSGYSWYVPDTMSSFNRTLMVSAHPASWVPWLESCAAITTYFARKSSTWRSCTILMVSTDSMAAGTGVLMLPSCTLVLGTDEWKGSIVFDSLSS